MSSPDQMMHEVGGFEVLEAKKVLAAFESAGVPFELEADNSPLGEPAHLLQTTLGMYPPGSKLRVFVPESALAKAKEIVTRLVPL